MLQLAAAALAVDGTRRRYPVRARLHDLYQLAIAKLLLQLHNSCQYLLARERAGNKQREALIAAYAFPIMTDPDDIGDDFIILANRKVRQKACFSFDRRSCTG